MNYKKYLLAISFFFLFSMPSFAYDQNEVETFYYTTTLETIGKYVDNEHTTLGYLYEYQGFLKQKIAIEFDKEKLEVLYKLLSINSENIQKQLLSLDTSKTNIEIFVKYFEGKHPDYQKNIDLIKTTQVINSKDENGDTLLKYVIKNGTFADIDFALNRGLSPNNKDKLGNIAFYDFIKTGGKFYPATFIDKLLAGKFDEVGTVNIINNILLKGFNPNLTDARNENILYAAFELKNPKILDIIFKIPGLDFNIKNIDGKTPLMYALDKLFDKSVILSLIQNQAVNINTSDYNWNTPLHLLVSKEAEYITELFKRGVNINTQNKNGENELTKLIGDEADETKIIEKYTLLKKYKPLKMEQKDTQGNNALMKSIQTGKLQVLKTLLKDTTDLDFTNNAGQNMLIFATYSSGTKDIIEAILPSTSNINLADIEGNTALHYAIKNGNNEIAGILLDSGLDLNILNKKNENMGTFIVDKNDYTLLSLALEKHFDVNTLINEKQTNLFELFAQKDKTEMIKLILKNKKIKINASHQDLLGETAVSYAIKNKNLELVTLLVQHGFEVNFKNQDGKTPLVFAAEVGDPNIVRFLIQAGASLDAEDKTGKNAFLYACARGEENTLKLIGEKTTDRKKVDNEGTSCLDMIRDSKTLSQEIYDLID